MRIFFLSVQIFLSARLLLLYLFNSYLYRIENQLFQLDNSHHKTLGYLCRIFWVILVIWHFKISQPIFHIVVTKSIITKCYVKTSLRNIKTCRLRIFTEKKSSISVNSFAKSFNFNPFLESRDPCTSYLPGLVDSDWSSGNNFHCNYTLNYELFPFFYCYDVINSIFYKTNSYSEIRNWSITLKGLLYIHIQINFVTRVPLDSIQLLKRHQVSPPEVSTLFRPWCNTKQKPFLT